MGLNGLNIGWFETRSQQVNDSKRDQISASGNNKNRQVGACLEQY